jgi:hypothetical protein
MGDSHFCTPLSSWRRFVVAWSALDAVSRSRRRPLTCRIVRRSSSAYDPPQETERHEHQEEEVRKTVLALAATLAFTGAGLAFAAAPASAENRDFSADNREFSVDNRDFSMENRDYSMLDDPDSRYWVDGGGVSTSSMNGG